MQQSYLPSITRAVTSSFYHGAHGALLVYDIASKVFLKSKRKINFRPCHQETFKSAKGWLSEIQRYATAEMVTYMVGNKQDLKAKREVPTAKGEVRAEFFFNVAPTLRCFFFIRCVRRNMQQRKGWASWKPQQRKQ